MDVRFLGTMEISSPGLCGFKTRFPDPFFGRQKPVNTGKCPKISLSIMLLFFVPVALLSKKTLASLCPSPSPSDYLPMIL